MSVLSATGSCAICRASRWLDAPDGARLPIRDGSAAVVALINAFLFPNEVERVLSRGGALVWVNSSGEQTPIYLSVDDLVARLPGEWAGRSSRAGEGHWCVLRRA